jgi:GxxExxY protein
MTELLFKEEVFQIVGAAMEVYNQLGNGFLEGVYQEALVMEFGLRGIPFHAQAALQITYKGRALNLKYVPDFVVYDHIIIELKAIKAIGANEEAQLLNYLKASGLRVGLLLNFGAVRRLEWSRFVL